MPIDFSGPEKPLETFSLSSIADITLLLLIFFLLSSSFIPQMGIQVNLPEANTSASTDEQFVTVVVTKDGQFYVDQNPVVRDSLAGAIQAARQQKTALVLRADQEATVGDFAAVASIARALDLRVLMATEREDTGPR
jgi:biopolymer transport protein ExbD